MNEGTDLLVPLNSHPDIDNAISKLVDVTHAAMNASIPKRKCKPQYLRLNTNIRNFIRLKNSLKRKWQRTARFRSKYAS